VIISHARAFLASFVLGFGLLSGCTMTVPAVSPTPSVAVSGDGTYSLDVSKVPDLIEPGRNVEITEVRKSIQTGFENAVGDAYRRDGGMRLVFDSFDASIDSGMVGVLRITYKVRWVAEDGKVVARAAGTALPKNPLQTGDDHWRDVLEVMFEQIVAAFDKAQERRRDAPPGEPAEPPGDKDAPAQSDVKSM
jgi:hypothetical protein